MMPGASESFLNKCFFLIHQALGTRHLVPRFLTSPHKPFHQTSSYIWNETLTQELTSLIVDACAATRSCSRNIQSSDLVPFYPVQKYLRGGILTQVDHQAGLVVFFGEFYG